MAASRRCKFAEETIETETRNVEQLNATVEEKFNEVPYNKEFITLGTLYPLCWTYAN